MKTKPVLQRWWWLRRRRRWQDGRFLLALKIFIAVQLQFVADSRGSCSPLAKPPPPAIPYSPNSSFSSSFSPQTTQASSSSSSTTNHNETAILLTTSSETALAETPSVVALTLTLLLSFLAVILYWHKRRMAKYSNKNGNLSGLPAAPPAHELTSSFPVPNTILAAESSASRRDRIASIFTSAFRPSSTTTTTASSSLTSTPFSNNLRHQSPIQTPSQTYSPTSSLHNVAGATTVLSSSGVGIGMMMVETTSSSITDQAFPVPGRSSNRSSAMLPSFHRAEQYSLAAITAIDSLGFDPPPKYSKADPLEWSSTT